MDSDVYIIVYKKEFPSINATADLVQQYGLERRFVYRHALNGAAIQVPPGRLNALRKDPRIAYIEKDQKVKAHVQTLPTGIDRIEAEKHPLASIDNIDERVDVDVAILDSGVDLDHPDLNVFRYTHCAQHGPMNSTCYDNDSGANDVAGHGTHVAGTVAALDNNIGVVGVAAGARIWAVKVLDDQGSGYLSWIIAGIDYVTAHASEIEVANMSLGGEFTSAALDAALASSVSAGVVYTVSAGNEQLDVSQVSPGGHPDVITVSALSDFDGLPGGIGNSSVSFSTCTENADDSFACFSNFGAGVDVLAPGIRIRSSAIGSGTTIMDGTSMASPHVAGAAALYRAENPGATPAQVKAALLSKADPMPCANGVNGVCSDDPDGIQEPLLRVCIDADGDGICDEVDNCPAEANPMQENNDNDSEGDVCDDDDDNDGFLDVEDAFPYDPAEWLDTDDDGVGDNGDNCLTVFNPSQTNTDGDGQGDACDVDDDNDGYLDVNDLFPLDASEWLDSDSDGVGNNADPDDDNDTVDDAIDNCPLVANLDQANLDGDGFGDACDVNPSIYNFADGDLNIDGVVDIRDILLGYQLLTDPLQIPQDHLPHGDVAPLVDGNPAPDGIFDLGDLLVIQRMVIGDI